MRRLIVACCVLLASGFAFPATPAPAWTPPVAASWQIILSRPYTTADLLPGVSIYDGDGFDNDAATVAAFHAAGAQLLCYIDVGTWENWRPDADQFPSTVLGQSNGWSGEYWLDIRQLDVLGPLMQARFQQQCADKGFDAIDPDNVDGYANATGFPLTYADQLAYNRAIATWAHAAGLSVGLKNDLDQIPDLLPSFDFAVNEQCFEYSECSAYESWLASGRAVFEIEYGAATSDFCPPALAAGRSAIKKRTALDAYRVGC